MTTDFAKKGLVTILLALGGITLLLAFWALRTLLLLSFAGILVAIFLRGLTNLVRAWTRLPAGLALTVVLLILAGLLTALGFLLAPNLARQIDQLFSALPASVDSFQDQISQYSWGRQLLRRAPAASQILPGPGDLLNQLGGAFTAFFGILANIVIVIFVGLFLAIDPPRYLHGLVKIFPPSKRERVAEVFTEAGAKLGWWLIGRVTAMTLVGFLTWLGLTLLDVPLALALSLFVMLLGFIPNLGPILAAAPAILIALSVRPMLGLYVALLYIAIQMLEGYVITPLIQQRAIHMPPALLIAAIVAGGLLFGFLGLLLAAPVTAVLLVFVQRFYFEDVLGDTAAARESRKE